MPTEPTLLPGFVFSLVVFGTFIAFLWYGCGLRDHRKEQRDEELRIKAERREEEFRIKAEQQRLQAIEENRRNEVRPLGILPRIHCMRGMDGNYVNQNPDFSCREETRVAIRKEIANASFFRRRRKAEEPASKS